MKSVIRKQLPHRNSIAHECFRQQGQEPLYPNEQYNKGLLLGLAENTLSCKMTVISLSGFQPNSYKSNYYRYV